jgi:Flp pilus assembly protein TadG
MINVPLRLAHPRRSGAPQPGSPWRERGVAIIEAAIITPLVFLLLFGVIEGGNLFYANLAVDEMAGHAVRTASITSFSSTSDYQVLQRIQKEQGANKVARINRVVIYSAPYRNASPTTACKAGTSSSVCSTYTGADFTKAASALTCGFCPDARVAGSLIGVYVSYSQPSVTGALGTKTLSSQSVTRIEAAS